MISLFFVFLLILGINAAIYLKSFSPTMVLLLSLGIKLLISLFMVTFLLAHSEFPINLLNIPQLPFYPSIFFFLYLTDAIASKVRNLFFYRRSDSKYFSICQPYALCCQYATVHYSVKAAI